MRYTSLMPTFFPLVIFLPSPTLSHLVYIYTCHYKMRVDLYKYIFRVSGPKTLVFYFLDIRMFMNF